MFRRLSLLVLVAAWLCADGTLLQVAQVLAWARMFSGYAQTCSLAQAAAMTFDPGRPCALCRAIQKAEAATRRDEPAQAPAARQAEKIFLICETAPLAVAVPAALPWARVDRRPGQSPPRSVALPPPRAADATIA